MTNPLLTDWTTPFGLPPFDQVSDDDYMPAVTAALEQSRANIAAIADDPAEPDLPKVKRSSDDGIIPTAPNIKTLTTDCADTNRIEGSRVEAPVVLSGIHL